MEHRGGQVTAEGGAAEAALGAQPLDHDASSMVRVGWSAVSMLVGGCGVGRRLPGGLPGPA